MAQIYKKNGSWYFIGTRFQGASVDLYRLLMTAKRNGESNNQPQPKLCKTLQSVSKLSDNELEVKRHLAMGHKYLYSSVRVNGHTAKEWFEYKGIGLGWVAV